MTDDYDINRDNNFTLETMQKTNAMGKKSWSFSVSVTIPYDTFQRNDQGAGFGWAS
jgi:hypothetical protein